jgi:hypothetical protein
VAIVGMEVLLAGACLPWLEQRGLRILRLPPGKYDGESPDAGHVGAPSRALGRSEVCGSGTVISSESPEVRWTLRTSLVVSPRAGWLRNGPSLGHPNPCLRAIDRRDP